MGNPPTEMNCGDALAPSQLGAAEVPVPGNAWHDAQSWLPGALVNELWSSGRNVAAGLTLRWQLLQRPVVPFITSGVPPEKLAWNEPCAHSLPATPVAVETPAWVWHALQSRPKTLISACVI